MENEKKIEGQSDRRDQVVSSTGDTKGVIIISGVAILIGIIGFLYCTSIVSDIRCNYIANPTNAPCILPAGISESDLGSYQTYALVSGLLGLAGVMGLDWISTRNTTLTLLIGIFGMLFTILFVLAAGLVPVVS